MAKDHLFTRDMMTLLMSYKDLSQIEGLDARKIVFDEVERWALRQREAKSTGYAGRVLAEFSGWLDSKLVPQFKREKLPIISGTLVGVETITKSPSGKDMPGPKVRLHLVNKDNKDETIDTGIMRRGNYRLVDNIMEEDLAESIAEIATDNIGRKVSILRWNYNIDAYDDRGNQKKAREALLMQVWGKDLNLDSSLIKGAWNDADNNGGQGRGQNQGQGQGRIDSALNGMGVTGVPADLVAQVEEIINTATQDTAPQEVTDSIKSAVQKYTDPGSGPNFTNGGDPFVVAAEYLASFA